MRFYVLIAALVSCATAQLITSGVPCTDVKTIVNKHNELRLLLAKGLLVGQPKASNMLRIVWDDKLQTMAQDYANKMIFAHNPNRTDSRWAVGENLYLSYSTSTNTSSDWNAAVTAWWNEYKLYTYGPIGDVSKTGHYTQVAWAKTMYIGCGFSHFLKSGWRQKLYVCNYGPAGNYIGQYPYLTGIGCETLCCTTQCGKNYGNNC